MADAATDLTALYNPVPVPAPLGEAPGAVTYQGGFTPQQRAMTGALSGGNEKALPPTLPVGQGTTMYTGPMFAQEDIANVGGVTGMASSEDTSVHIPEIIDPSEEQTEEFMEAWEDDGRSGARKARREDRRDDRDIRKEERADRRAELESDDVKKGKARRISRREKRQSRRADRKARKQSWKDYKGDRSLAEYEQSNI